MTVAQLKLTLELLPQGYEVHIEGQEINQVSLHERVTTVIKWQSMTRGERTTEGVVNLVAAQQDEG